MVVFANDERLAGKDRREAALNAGYTRLRPVLMTALAMIIGMLPMALAFGEGGEQNAPLGRAVIGGLLFATMGTLFLVPTIYSLLKKHPPIDYTKEIETRQTTKAKSQVSSTPNAAAWNLRSSPRNGRRSATKENAAALARRERADAAGDESEHARCDPRARWRDSFADPNSLDDARLGKSFEKTNSQRKRRSDNAAEGEARCTSREEPQGRCASVSALRSWCCLCWLLLLAGGCRGYFRDKETTRRRSRAEERKAGGGGGEGEAGEGRRRGWRCRARRFR